MAWFTVLLMALTLAWPDSQNLFIQRRYPIVIDWPMMLTTLALAILVSAPRLIPRYRVMACKLLSIGLLAVCFFLFGGAPTACLIVVAGKIFLGAKKQ